MKPWWVRHWWTIGYLRFIDECEIDGATKREIRRVVKFGPVAFALYGCRLFEVQITGVKNFGWRLRK